jgi:NADP-dependent 3-hydroxy acid dehydrogenase YdfG
MNGVHSVPTNLGVFLPGMIQQLSSSAGSEFTQAQAQYGATKVGLC